MKTEDNNTERPYSSIKTILNILFVLLSGSLLFFLWRAPEETTAFLPKDATHIQFHKIKSKKEAEQYCLQCHGDDKEAPMAQTHPPKYRCLFCHKRK